MPFITTRSVGANCIASLSYRLRFREMRSHIVSAARGRPWRTYTTENLHPSASNGFRSGRNYTSVQNSCRMAAGVRSRKHFRKHGHRQDNHTNARCSSDPIARDPRIARESHVRSRRQFFHPWQFRTCHGILLIAGKDEIECRASPKPDWTQTYTP